LTAIDDSKEIPAPGGDAAPGPGAGRLALASVMRQLGHAIVGHEVADEELGLMRATLEEFLNHVEAAPARVRPMLHMNGDLFVVPPAQGGVRGSHFHDCIVTGPANPMGVAARTLRDGDDAVVRCTLGDAFEGAPGRAHGGMVAALFDEAMGFVLSINCTPAFTGRLTVTYRAPVPIGVPLEFRARLTGRQGRKLLMAGEARHGAVLLAEAESLFVAVDPERFAAGQG